MYYGVPRENYVLLCHLKLKFAQVVLKKNCMVCFDLIYFLYNFDSNIKLITMNRPKAMIDIDYLIKQLVSEKKKGAKKVTLEGRATLIVGEWNSVILTTESQM